MFGAPYPTRPSQRSRHLASRWRRPTPRSVRQAIPSHTSTCSSAVCDTRHRRAGAAPDLASSPTEVHALTSPHRRPRASLPRFEMLDLRGSRPGRAVVGFNQQYSRTPPTPQHPLAHASTARQDSRSSRRISVAVHAMPHAPLPLPSVLLVPPHAHSASLFHAGPRTPFPLPAVSSSGFPPFSWPAVLSFYSLCIAPRAAPACMRACLLARTRTTDERTTRRAVRRRG